MEEAVRTIKVELEAHLPDANGDASSDVIRISTEVIIDEGEEAQAGRDAKGALDRFIAGYGTG